jgi:hypothetical protein
MPGDEGDRPPAEDAVVGMIEGLHASKGGRSSGDVAASFPDEEIDDEPGAEPYAQRFLNGGSDVGH